MFTIGSVHSFHCPAKLSAASSLQKRARFLRTKGASSQNRHNPPGQSTYCLLDRVDRSTEPPEKRLSTFMPPVKADQPVSPAMRTIRICRLRVAERPRDKRLAISPGDPNSCFRDSRAQEVFAMARLAVQPDVDDLPRSEVWSPFSQVFSALKRVSMRMH